MYFNKFKDVGKHYKLKIRLFKFKPQQIEMINKVIENSEDMMEKREILDAKINGLYNKVDLGGKMLRGVKDMLVSLLMIILMRWVIGIIILCFQAIEICLGSLETIGMRGYERWAILAKKMIWVILGIEIEQIRVWATLR